MFTYLPKNGFSARSDFIKFDKKWRKKAENF